jgi:ribosomal protein S27E
MVRCPICESVQIGFLLSPRPTSCYYCGATWLQDGGQQTAVRGKDPHRDEVKVSAEE